MKENNQIRMYVRIKELMIDYIVILLYLILLLIANLAFYFLMLGGDT
ncbi:MAG: hypothetical protein RR649_06825 [Carnobacterium sp.]